MRNLLITLAEIHYEFGLIEKDELNERIGVALWLAEELDDSVGDPRNDEEQCQSESEEIESSAQNPLVESSVDRGNEAQNTNVENWLEFLCLGVWVFTKADPDPYPSIPHGHYKNQNNKWPKLNPYTGRVFNSKQQEAKSERLSKEQMQIIWRDEKFKSFCREMIVWYREQFSSYKFPVRSPSRMPKW